MDAAELLRIAILGLGWPVLILGSVRMSVQAYRFHRRVGATSFGRLIVILVAGLLVTMYSLGVTATAFMWINPAQGVPIVMPIFAGWFVLMLFVASSMGRWTHEVENVSDFYRKLDEASRARIDLVNRASHELSTPLTPLLIQAELLQDAHVGPLNPAQSTARAKATPKNPNSKSLMCGTRVSSVGFHTT
jgi:signal transduction histidine kinase